MIGKIVVMEPDALQRWLSGAAPGGSAEIPVAAAGERVFQQSGCISCHRGDSGARGPNLAGLFGSTVRLADGGTVTADEAYLRESILRPTAKLVAGYEPIMPTYQGILSEEAVLQMIEYLKTLGPAAAEARR
jgi:cytochrome c oxidase subunit 2